MSNHAPQLPAAVHEIIRSTNLVMMAARFGGVDLEIAFANAYLAAVGQQLKLAYGIDVARVVFTQMLSALEQDLPGDQPAAASSDAQQTDAAKISLYVVPNKERAAVRIRED